MKHGKHFQLYPKIYGGNTYISTFLERNCFENATAFYFTLKHNPLICYFEVAFSTQKRYVIKESVGNKRGN